MTPDSEQGVTDAVSDERLAEMVRWFSGEFCPTKIGRAKLF